MDEDGMAVASETTIDDLESRLNDADACIAQLEEKVSQLEAALKSLRDDIIDRGLFD